MNEVDIANDINIQIEQECPICKEIFKDKFITDCKHLFCRECLKKCCKFDLYDKCPLCQQLLTLNDKNILSGGAYTKIYDDTLQKQNKWYWILLVINLIIYGTLGSFSIYFSAQKDVFNQGFLVANGIWLFIAMILASPSLYYFIFDETNGINVIKYGVANAPLFILSMFLMIGKCNEGCTNPIPPPTPILILSILEMIYALKVFIYLLSSVIFFSIYCFIVFLYEKYQNGELCQCFCDFIS